MTCMAMRTSGSLYRIAGWAVILVATAALVPGQIARRSQASKGPRAVALIEVLANGKARLRPVCIMVAGRFFDAAAYKATPVPMSLDAGTVYEATKGGESAGLFTVSGARQANRAWIGEGKFLLGTPEERERKPAAVSKKPKEDADAPPVLRRPGSQKSAPAAAPEPKSAPEAKPGAESKPAPAPAVEDPDRPILRRGKASSVGDRLDDKELATTGIYKARYVAVSDAGGPDFRPFSYTWSPQEEQGYRKTMLADATQAVRAKETASAVSRPKPGKAAPIDFKDVTLQVFDVASNNSPVLVLTASTASGTHVTAVERVDLYGELQKMKVEATDERRLDVSPRLELVDVVDADGDGVAELMFQEFTDHEQGIVIYRVGPDQLLTVYDSLRQ